MYKQLSSALDQKVTVLQLCQDGATGNFTWEPVRRRWASVVPDAGRNLFSSVGIGARGAAVTLRTDPGLTLHNALLWEGQFLFLTSLVCGEQRDRLELKAAVCDPIVLTANPQDRTGRDEMNRPTIVKQAAFSFPGILTELYRRNQPEEVYRTISVQRALVTPKEIKLRPGTVLTVAGGERYVVRTVQDLDAYKNEYVLEQEVDV